MGKHFKNKHLDDLIPDYEYFIIIEIRKLVQLLNKKYPIKLNRKIALMEIGICLVREK